MTKETSPLRISLSSTADAGEYASDGGVDTREWCMTIDSAAFCTASVTSLDITRISKEGTGERGEKMHETYLRGRPKMVGCSSAVGLGGTEGEDILSLVEYAMGWEGSSGVRRGPCLDDGRRPDADVDWDEGGARWYMLSKIISKWRLVAAAQSRNTDHQSEQGGQFCDRSLSTGTEDVGGEEEERERRGGVGDQANAQHSSFSD
jgi:hypothetical protein